MYEILEEFLAMYCIYHVLSSDQEEMRLLDSLNIEFAMWISSSRTCPSIVSLMNLSHASAPRSNSKSDLKRVNWRGQE